MPGINLNLPIPSLSDTQTIVITKIAQALTSINTDLTAQIIPSEISINSTLHYNGNGLDTLGFATFASIIPPAPLPGTLYYIGEWFVTTPVGAIQLTNAGALNLSSVGGIGGDYSAVSALVSYDNANTRYRFFGGAGTSLVDLDARKLALEGSSAIVTFGVDPALVTNKTINIKALPTVGIGLIAYDATNTAIVDATATAITATTTFTADQIFNGNITTNGLTKHTTAYSAELSLVPEYTSGTYQYPNNSGASDAILQVSSKVGWQPLTSQGLRVNDKLQTAVLRVSKAAADTLTATIFKQVLGGAPVIIQQNTTTTIGTSDLIITVGVPVAIASRERWWIELSTTAGGTATVRGVTMTWTQ